MVVSEKVILQRLPATDPPILFRVLHVNYTEQRAYVLPIINGRFEIFDWGLDEIDELIKREQLESLPYDPYEKYMKPLEEFTKDAQKRIKRARAFIEELQIECGSGIFDRRIRGEKIEILRKKQITVRENKITIMSQTTAYLYVRIYWESGELFNAIGGNFHNCGGKGKKRIAQENDPKRGRPPNEKGKKGANLTAEYRKIFVNGYKKYVLGQGLTIEDAYQKICENDLYRYVIDEATGELKKELLKWWNRPSIWQFYAVCREEREKSPKEANIAEVGIRDFNLNHRSMKQSSTKDAFGPLSLYQFDASRAPFACRNPLDPSTVITELTMYLGADVYTHGICAGVLSLIRESWEGYSLLIADSLSNKVEVCAKYGIAISRDDYPFDQKPIAILGDRGPLKGKNADSIVEAGMNLATTSPYRADLKAIAEWVIKYMQDEIFRDEDGYHPEEQKRGEGDYRPTAIYTVEELMPRFLRAILRYNKTHPIKPYPFTDIMIANSVIPTPLGLFEYGQTLVGSRPRYTNTLIRKKFYYTGKGSARDDGIYFNQAYYEPKIKELEDADTEEEYEGALHLRRLIEKSAWKDKYYSFSIRYDKFGAMHSIYVVYKDSLIECVRRQNDVNTAILHNRTHEEVDAYNKLTSIRDKNLREDARQQRAEDNAKDEEEKQAAKARTKRVIEETGITRSGQAKNTRENTAAARQQEREKRYHEERGSQMPKNKSTNGNTSSNDDKTSIVPPGRSYVPPINYTSALSDAYEDEEQSDE